MYCSDQVHYFIAVEELRKELCDAVVHKYRNSGDSVHVPLQIVKYKESDGEVFGEGFDLRKKNEVHSKTAVSYDASMLFSEAEKQGENFLGVVGEPGVGKTSLITSLLMHLTADNDNCPLVFHIPIRRISDSKLTTFELLVQELLPDWSRDKSIEDALIKVLNKHADVYILIDGLDEAENKVFSSAVKNIKLCKPANVYEIIKYMFEGNIFKSAKKLVTSRPDAFLSLHPKCKPDFKVQILGLSEESQRELSMQICGNNDEKYRKVQTKLEMNPDLAALCYIPLHCKMIVEHLKNSPEGASLTHITSTHVFTQALCDYSRSKDEHFRGEEDFGRNLDVLLKLMELALNGIEEKKFIFSLRNCSESEKKVFTNFLKVKTDSSSEYKILDGNKHFFFVHLLWQELFAAMKLMLFADENQFKKYLQKLCEDEWRSVVHFLYGLSNAASQRRLEEMFTFRSELLSAKLEFLKSLLGESNVTDGKNDPRNQLVLPCSWAFEADQQIITEEVIDLLPDTLKLPEDIQPKDAVAISYVLSYDSRSQRKFTIEMNEPSTFHGKSLKILLEAANFNSHRVSGIMVYV